MHNIFNSVMNKLKKTAFPALQPKNDPISVHVPLHEQEVLFLAKNNNIDIQDRLYVQVLGVPILVLVVRYNQNTPN